MSTTPVYKGKVVTVTGRDRLGIFFTAYWPADKADEKRAAKEAAGDTITYVGKPRPARPGEVPQATAKTVQQERAEKAAAKLVSKNKQVAANREATKAKRQLAVKPPVVAAPKAEKPVQPAPQPKPVVAKQTKVTKPKATKRAYVRRVPSLTAVAVVCLSTGKYYPTLTQAQASQPVGEKNRSLAQSLTQKGGITRYRGKIYAYATEEEKAAGACLRSAKDVHLQKQVSGNPAMSWPLLLIDTGVVYRTVGELIAAVHLSRRRFIRMQPGEVRQTPAGGVRYATQREIQQWKQAHGGQMQIAFNQR